jgi:hypothetical protein
MSPGVGACEVAKCCSAKAVLSAGTLNSAAAKGALRGSAGEVLRLRLAGAAILPVIKAARFPDTPRSGTLTVRERVFALEFREEYQVDPQNQPKPNAVTIATATMQRASAALFGATALMLLIQAQAS